MELNKLKGNILFNKEKNLSLSMISFRLICEAKTLDFFYETYANGNEYIKFGTVKV